MQLDEGPPHPFRIGESHSQGNLFDRFAASLQAQPRSFDSQALDRPGRRFTGFPAKSASELPQTQSCGISEPLDRQGFSEMFPRKIQCDADAIRFRLHPRHGGELGLPSWSTIRNHQKPGHGARNLRAHVAFNDAERQVYPGGDARRRPDAAILDIDAVAVDPDAREARLQLRSVSPVGRRSQAVQQAGFRKQKGARTHARHARGLGGQFPGRGNILRCLHRIDITTHENDGIERAPSDRHRLDRKARIAMNQASGSRDDMKLVWRMAGSCGHLIESRQRPAKIKRIVATANEESDSMHDEAMTEIPEVAFYREPSNSVIWPETREKRR